VPRSHKCAGWPLTLCFYWVAETEWPAETSKVVTERD